MTSGADAPPDAPPRVRRPLWTSAWLLVLVLVVFGFGFAASRQPAPADLGPPAGDVAAAQSAIEALVHPGPAPLALDRLPADFTAVTGIRPGSLPARDGTVRAVHTDGGCSAPWGEDNTRWDFAVPCKAHDLGYDLLRYAAAKGHPLGPEVRRALDDRLSTDMHATCGLNPRGSAVSCELTASFYTAGLVVNSWHQRWGPPNGEPLGPMFAGVGVIACLLVFRLRGWLRAHRGRSSRPAAIRQPPAPVLPAGNWATLGVASITGLVLGESMLALANWAGAAPDLLWPVTWLVQLAPLFFFAGGRANATGWLAVRATGGGYREYLAHRASWLLRPALVFALVALIVPIALELLRIPTATNATVVRIALHPLWLLGMYLLTVVLTPVMLALRRQAAAPVLALLLGVAVAGEPLADRLGSPLPGYAAAFALALLAQQLAFGPLPRRRPAIAALLLGLGGLALLCGLGLVPVNLLNSIGSTPALAAPVPGLLLLGLAQLGALGLLRARLIRVSTRPRIATAVGWVLRAPMSLYLAFLAAMMLLVALVYLPGRISGDVIALLRPGTLTALALLACPAALVFWWFERHLGAHGVPEPAARCARTGLSALLGRAATMLGVGYASLGVFGLALTRFGGEDSGTTLLGLPVDPIQALTHLLLGVFLLHTVRIGTSATPVTWLVTLLACGPPLLSATEGRLGLTGVLLYGLTALFALAAVLASSCRAIAATRTAVYPLGS